MSIALNSLDAEPGPEFVKYKKEFDDDEICSCCLAIAGGHLLNMHDSFDNNGKHESYIDVVNQCYNSQILNPDEPPGKHQICDDCLDRLNDSCKFKRQITEAQKSLRELFNERDVSCEVKGDLVGASQKVDDFMLMNCANIKADSIKQDSDHEYDQGIEFFEYDPAESQGTFSIRASPRTKNQLKKTKNRESRDAQKSIRQSTKSKIVLSKSSKTSMKSKSVNEIKRPSGRPRKANKPLSLMDAIKSEQESTPEEMAVNLTTSVESQEGSDDPTKIDDVKYQGHLQDVKIKTELEVVSHLRALLQLPKKRKTRGKYIKRQPKQMRESTQPFNKTIDEEVMAAMDIPNKQCRKCLMKFTFLQHLRSHMPKHFPNYMCETCGKSFATSISFRSHMQQQHLTGRFECSECDKVFSTYKDASNHKKKHKTDRYRCRHCKENFTSSHFLRLHQVDKHDTGKRYSCDRCEATFKIHYYLYRHVRNEHTVRERKHHCEYCDKLFYSKVHLKTHLVMHTEEKKFLCNVCNKAFMWKKNLVLHMKIHTNVKNQLCVHCGESFVQKASLNWHLRKHGVVTESVRQNKKIRDVSMRKNETMRMPKNKYSKPDFDVAKIINGRFLS